MNRIAEIGVSVTVPAGSGYNGVSPVVLVSRTIPSGTTFLLRTITAKVIDIGSEQITFAVRRNGAYPSQSLTNLSGVLFDDTKTIEVDEEFAPGMMEIVASNKSGTTEPNAIIATSATCQASLIGSLIPMSISTPSFREQIKNLFKIQPSFYKKFLLALCPIMGLTTTICLAEPQAVTLGMTSVRSALPIVCVNPTTFLLESCAGSSGVLVHNILSATHTDTTVAVTVAGDLLRFNTTWERLGIGSSGNVLTVSAGLPVWAAPALVPLTTGVSGILPLANGGTNQNAWTAARCVRVNAGGTALEAAAGDCTVGSGLTSLNGLTGGTQTFTDDTNVTMVSGGTAHVITWVGLLSVARGGTGVGTLTGLILGNGTSPFSAYAGFTCTNQFASALSVSGGATCTTSTLAGPQHANQGTTTTLLHGNAAGNPAFGAVVSADLSLTINTCTNQFPRSSSSTSVWTCASIVSADVPTALKSGSKSVTIQSPTTAITNLIQWEFPSAITISEIACSTDTGTATIQLDERARVTPNTAGTNVLTSSLVCDNDSQVSSTFTNAGIAADVPLNLQVTAVASTPGVVRVHLQYTID